MKHLQGKFMLGFITLNVYGQNPELFLQQLVNAGIYVWDVQKINTNCCQVKIRRHTRKAVQSLAEHSSYDITFADHRGLPSLIESYIQKREIIIACLLSLLLFIFLSQFVWSIEISGVTEEVEMKINSHLKKGGIKKGTFKPLLANPSTIQQNLLLSVPELLWIGVEQNGTNIKFSGIEKISHENQETTSPQHLIAKKSGVIEKMSIAKGVPLVAVNDYVNKGDRLVSGNLADAKLVDEDNEEQAPENLVAAQGEIMARTWYNVQVTVPLSVGHDQLTGHQLDKYYVAFGNKKLLLWGFQKENYHHSIIEENEFKIDKLYDLLPIKLVKQSINEVEQKYYVRSIEEAKQVGISEAKARLTLQIDANAKVLSQKVLHESTESGKVRLNLLITVSENIVDEIPITQGD